MIISFNFIYVVILKVNTILILKVNATDIVKIVFTLRIKNNLNIFMNNLKKSLYYVILKLGRKLIVNERNKVS